MLSGELLASSDVPNIYNTTITTADCEFAGQAKLDLLWMIALNYRMIISQQYRSAIVQLIQIQPVVKIPNENLLFNRAPIGMATVFMALRVGNTGNKTTYILCKTFSLH